MPAKSNSQGPTPEPITKAQEEEMSSALIAKLLAEDSMATGNDDYYAEYSNSHAYSGSKSEEDDSYEENSDDDNFAPRQKKRRGRPTKAKAAPDSSEKKKRGRKRKTTEAVDDNQEQTEGTEADATSGSHPSEDKEAKPAPTKKPRKPLPEGYNTGPYTDEEERRFLEALEQFGRDWVKVTAHIGTRDPNSIRSHAQKHFIKMFRDQIPLPEKVRESGEGYTLSGKPLDPNSAAAKPYLGKMAATPSSTKAGAASTTATATTTTTTTTPSTSNTSATGTTDQDVPALKVSDNQQDESKKFGETDQQENKSDPSSNPSTSANATPSPDTPAPNAQSRQSPGKQSTPKKEKKPKRERSPRDSASKIPNLPAQEYGEDGRTSYSKSRLRQSRQMSSVSYQTLSKNDDPFTLVKCEQFDGPPGSNRENSQPFDLQVHTNAVLAIDFHAHLMTTEIIGFLAGEWDSEKKKLCIREAFPCRSIETGQNDVNVEMDPTSALETRQLIEDKQMKVVGWYHSHPTFVPDPSIIDCENQRNYQHLCSEKHAEGNDVTEPFVGAIIAPYDPQLPASASALNWFYIGRSRSKGDILVPNRFVYDVVDDSSFSQEEADRLFGLLDVYKHSQEKVSFGDMWRQDASESKLQKLIKSLAGRMPWLQKEQASNEEIDPFLTRVHAELKDW
ncbi:hypothetical protein BCR43DRAFT_498203 [Syncephalastrum racemosum]|uniref:Myb-like, SWIRM and MPN domain-containing protein 1 n=1 Tax=Syncephalastrum racemosum TaxID=13706 RepID=A0A1X2H3H1_SYNRA|nr:hypothetical protein BCR43DRAFT_498203 [Syncephalastrum racemosum]